MNHYSINSNMSCVPFEHAKMCENLVGTGPVLARYGMSVT